MNPTEEPRDATYMREIRGRPVVELVNPKNRPGPA